MSKNRISDEQLDKMLTNYCNRKPQYTFRLKKEAKAMKKRSVIRYATACLGVALLVCAAIFVPNLTSADKQEGSSATDNNSYTPAGFFVTAYAAETDETDLSEGVKIDGVDTVIETDNPNFDYDSRGLIQNLSFGRVGLEISGENIESFDVSTDNGRLMWVNEDIMEEYKKDNKPIPDDKIADYYKQGQSLSGIAFDNDNPQRSMVDWVPSGEKRNEALSKATGIENVENPSSEEELETISAKEKELIQTSEDVTEYFGGTVSVTVHYKDGASESCKIKISFDKNGYYIVSAAN